MDAHGLKGFEAFTASASGVDSLRQLILDLAMRGRLVEQDSSDESASLPAKRVDSDRQRHSAAVGTRTKDQPDVPHGWSVVALGEACRFIDYRGRTPTKTSSGVPLITAKNVRPGRINREPREYVSEATYKDWMTRGFPRIGDVLFTTEAPMGNAAEVDISEPFALAQRVINLHPHADIHGRFVMYALQSPQLQDLIRQKATGTTAQGIKAARLKTVPLPVPPADEQRRIVVKVDELMALCDDLEEKQSRRHKVRRAFQESALDALSNAESGEELAEAWARVRDNWDAVTERSDCVPILRDTILRLATRGELVPQEESGESVEARLTVHREQDAQNRKLNRKAMQGGGAPIKDSERPFRLPPTWVWARLGEVAEIKHGYAFKSSQFAQEPTPFVLTTPGHFYEAGGFRDRGAKTKYFAGHVNQEFVLAPGDFIIPMTEQAPGLLGSPAFVPDDGKRYLHNQRLGKVTLRGGLVSPQFLFWYFNGSYFRSQLAKTCTGTTVRHTSPSRILKVLIPICPLSEQRRIVATIDQLVALCDQMGDSLRVQEEKSSQLAEAVVHSLSCS